MDWLNFSAFALIVTVLLVVGTTLITSFNSKKTFLRLGDGLIILAIMVMASFIGLLWVHLERPPLRTLGETRLLYTFFLSLVGFIIYKRWNLWWFLYYTNSMALLFLTLNYLHPDNYDKTLMPALQSVWFAPHVIVYILGYAILVASTFFAVKGLYQLYFTEYNEKNLQMADNLVYIGFTFLTLGLVFGALWAKKAWGHYWTWDPKETWALLTYLSYLIYIHLRHNRPTKIKWALWVLSLAFVVLMIAWMGINYLPSAQSSVHVYSN